MRLAALALILAPSIASAHDFTPGVLALEETEPGLFLYAWTPPVDSGSTIPGALRFPRGCTSTETLLDCRPGGLEGTIEFPGLSDQRVQVVVVIRRHDGEREESMIWGDDPRFEVGAQLGGLALAGPLQLVLVLALVLAARARREMLLCLTAFTLAFTTAAVLAASSVRWLPAAPVQATIAVAALLLARESMREADARSRRFLLVVAPISGALLGLGITNDGATSVVLGQLVVAAAAAIGALFLGAKSRSALAYTVGAAAAYGLIAGTFELVTNL